MEWRGDSYELPRFCCLLTKTRNGKVDVLTIPQYVIGVDYDHDRTR
jgi:hypothetical protein